MLMLMRTRASWNQEHCTSSLSYVLGSLLGEHVSWRVTRGSILGSQQVLASNFLFNGYLGPQTSEPTYQPLICVFIENAFLPH